MPLSQGNFSAGPVGIELKAWALVNPATGAIVSGIGFDSVTRTSAGIWAFALTNALPHSQYIVKSQLNQSSNPYGANDVISITSKTTSSFTLKNERYNPGVGVFNEDGSGLHVSVWA